MMNLKDKLYTSTEVADILGVSLRSIYRYLEDDKLSAEVKTATGRHRFTKDNILNFLYPDGLVPEEDEVVTEPKKVTQAVIDEVSVEVKEIKVTEVLTPEAVQSEDDPIEEVEDVEEEEQVEVDWLTKFREAAAKFDESGDAKSVPDSAPVSGLADIPAVEEEEEAQPVLEPVSTKETTFYYRSGVGGLREIAQTVDKTARSANVEYAFTMSAGLSLHKLVKPFSLLHVYVKSDTRPLFESSLRLQPAAEDGAELAILIEDNDTVYQEKEERHGLFVASPTKLLADAKLFGDEALVAEAQSIIA